MSTDQVTFDQDIDDLDTFDLEDEGQPAQPPIETEPEPSSPPQPGLTAEDLARALVQSRPQVPQEPADTGDDDFMEPYIRQMEQRAEKLVEERVGKALGALAPIINESAVNNIASEYSLDETARKHLASAINEAQIPVAYVGQLDKATKNILAEAAQFRAQRASQPAPRLEPVSSAPSASFKWNGERPTDEAILMTATTMGYNLQDRAQRRDFYRWAEKEGLGRIGGNGNGR